MSDKIFVDTNILVYAHDKDSGEKHATALAIVKDIWEKRIGVLSNQVLQEFYVAVTRKIPKPIAKSEAREILRAYSCWSIKEIPLFLSLELQNSKKDIAYLFGMLL